MNRPTASFAMLSLLCMMLWSSEAFPQQSGTMAQPSHLSEASSYIGRSLRGPDGKNLGRISDLVIDRANKRVLLAVLSDVPGLETKVVAIPFASLTSTGKRLSITSYGLNEVWLRILNASMYLHELKRDLSLVGLPSTIDPEWVYQIYLRYDRVPYWKEAGANEKPLSEKEIVSLNGLMRSIARLSQGKMETRISDLIIDPSDGRVAFMILSHVSEPVDTKVAVPFGSLAMKDNHAFTINLTDHMLAEAPVFGDRDKIDLKWASNVYKYFGVQPYWTEEEQ